MSKFKIGDRVRFTYFDDEITSFKDYSSRNFGFIDSKHDILGGCWWVKWDNGDKLYATENTLELVSSNNESENKSKILLKELLNNDKIASLLTNEQWVKVWDIFGKSIDNLNK